MSFIDEIKVYVKGGKGGNGCISFRREKFVALGGPDGGKGGAGGDITFRASKKYNTLLKFHYQPHIKGDNGEHGSSGRKCGSAGKNTIIEVPIGTQIYDIGDNLIADLTIENQRITAAKGGEGGIGNAGSKNYVKDKYYNPGSEGEENTLLLKLKIIADVGIIGLPNAGKSTFLSLCSNAHPKIANYQFTTLCPQIGMVKLDGYRDFIMADIPGLIEGAHKGLGLGHKFLKHIERCRSILHLIDCTQEDVIATYNTVRNELKSYNETLSVKNELVAMSKCDIPDNDTVTKKVKTLEDYLQRKVYKIASDRKTHQLINEIYNSLNKKEEKIEFNPIN
ncbi:MAG: GTPase ObgE [Rickettsiaceae bacterium H1]|nr:GTPase ObgE [Rickettsiaceae bacterium H1]